MAADIHGCQLNLLKFLFETQLTSILHISIHTIHFPSNGSVSQFSAYQAASQFQTDGIDDQSPNIISKYIYTSSRYTLYSIPTFVSRFKLDSYSLLYYPTDNSNHHHIIPMRSKKSFPYMYVF